LVSLGRNEVLMPLNPPFPAWNECRIWVIGASRIGDALSATEIGLTGTPRF
jgi:hypothetical protein